MKKLLLLALAFSFLQAEAQSPKGWRNVSDLQIDASQKIRTTEYSERQQLFQLEENAFRASLSNAGFKEEGKPGIVISLPSIDGHADQYLIWETSNFAPELRARFPEIKSYVGKGITDPAAYIRFSVSPLGIQTMVLRADKGAEFIEPYTTDSSVYVLFDSATRIKGHLPFTCSTVDQRLNDELLHRTAQSPASNDQIFRTYRLALSCTGEYGQYFGGTVAGALAGMNATMTRVNGVFETDMSLKLEIIANNDLVIYTNAASDPYSAAGVGSAGAWNAQLQNTLTNVLGNAAYDIGHLFGRSGGGGNAGCIGCVCVDDSPSTTDTNKGSGFTSPSDAVPQGDSFDIDYVVHEMGHQLGANHTFSHFVEGSGVNIEPGSGITIMGYAGVSNGFDIDSNSLPFFAYRSILQVQQNLEGTCSVNTILTNNPPSVEAGPTMTIPKSTPFVLRGIVSDADGDALTLVWEENDNAPFSADQENSFPSPTKISGPNFRSFMPSESPDRFMPSYETVLAGSLSNTWEAISSVGRQLKFTLTGRDNVPGAAQTNTDSKIVNVTGTAGPFEVTSQNTLGTSWLQGEQQTITWGVNNTTNLAGSANVNIKLSIDGGWTFPITLASNTPNDGSEIITVPDTTAENCRIWIEPTGNIYYAINAAPFSIGYDCNTAGDTPNLAIPDGVGNNQTGAIVTSTLTVSEEDTIDGMTVTVNSDHTWVGDMVIRITHPDGTQRTLWNRGCNAAQNSGLNITFEDGAGAVVCGSPTAGTYSPNQTLAAFNGKPTNGTWTIQAQDFFLQDTGTIISWNINFGCQLDSNEFEAASNFTVYPNPNQGSFTVAFNADSNEDVKILVHDIRGRLIFERNYDNNGLFTQDISIDKAQSGLYLVTVTTGGKKMVKKIVVE